jgi:kynurenine formamidase
MIITLENGRRVDLSRGLDLSLELTNSEVNPRAWYVDAPKFEPVMEHGWVGAVALGGAVNFRNIFFNPHGHGTHTECLGHITPEIYSVQNSLTQFFFHAVVVSVTPEIIEVDGALDHVVTAAALQHLTKSKPIDALIVRTLPNDTSKKQKNYSATNPAYFALDCIDILNKLEVQHLLIDLPSVDREKDGGALAFHHAFWGVPDAPNHQRTITELIYVDSRIPDGEYLLNLQVANFNNDAAPSRPILFEYL